MEYINFGKVVNVSASVPVAVNDTAYHIIIDFVPNCPEIFDSFHTDMDKILEWPDDYVLCNVSDIKELEDLGADLNEHIKNLERIKEFLINGNTTLINENGKLKATNQALKDRIKELEDQLSDQKKNYDKKQAEQIEELEKDRDYWKDSFGSIVIDVSKVLEANGVEFTAKAIDGNKWNAIIDIPELNEAKKKVDDLEKKLAAAKSNETYWRDRKEEEEEYHHYWLHTFDRAVKQAADKGINIDVCGTDEECNAGVVIVDNGKANELESQVVQMEDANQKLRKRISAADEEIERLKGDNSAKAKAVIRAEYRGDAWMDEHGKLIRKYLELEQRHDAKWSAMTEALKDKGVEVIYMGEEDGKPNIDIKIPAVGDLKKELDDMKDKTVAEVRYELHSDCFTVIYTKCDGSKQTVGMDLADDTDEKCTMGAFVCRAFNIPQCKECKNHRYYGKISGHLCHLPDSKCIIPNTFDIFPLTDEEAEGPACDKFEAKE